MDTKYDMYIMEMLRQRLGLEEDDTSLDDLIASYTPNEVFEEVLIWKGIIGFGSMIRDIIKDVYAIDLDKVSSNAK